MIETQHLDITTLLSKLERAVQKEINTKNLKDPLIVGIHTGGTWIAEKLHSRLGLKDPPGVLNISFYRDDFSQIGMHPHVTPSHLQSVVEGRDVLLVDDVLFTGRTIRAAMNEIFDYGRPNQIILAVLIDRNGRQIPIQADCVGEKIMLESGHRIKLIGPDPLQLIIRDCESEST